MTREVLPAHQERGLVRVDGEDQPDRRPPSGMVHEERSGAESNGRYPRRSSMYGTIASTCCAASNTRCAHARGSPSRASSRLEA